MGTMRSRSSRSANEPRPSANSPREVRNGRRLQLVPAPRALRGEAYVNR